MKDFCEACEKKDKKIADLNDLIDDLADKFEQIRLKCQFLEDAIEDMKKSL